jgi:pimeloyl-ACP methyl ester carboxylesterase
MDAATRRVRFVDATGAGASVVHLQADGARSRVVAILAQHLRVLSFAVGDSGAASLDALTLELADALSQQAHESIGVIADATAADTALALAVARPELVRALALVAPSVPGGALAALKAPVLALFGTRQAPAQIGRKMREAIANCHVVFVYDADHDMANERPEAVASVLREFLIAGDRFLVTDKSGKLYP